MRIRPLIYAMALGCGLATQTFGADTPSPLKDIAGEDQRYAALARKRQSEGWNFERIFTEQCQAVLDTVNKNSKTRLDDECRYMFGGLWLWARNGGNPALQGQNDKAQHFIGGGAFEGYWDAGRSAAVVKERIDMRNPDNFFDLDDMAATMMGARWMDLATNTDAERARRWVELWAGGQFTLAKSLPELKNGHLAPRQRPSDEKIRAIRIAIETALALPPAKPDQSSR